MANQHTAQSEIVKIRQVELAIEALEKYRAFLGDEIVNSAVAPLIEQLRRFRRLQEISNQQRKFVSVLFVDISSSTESSQDLELEEMAAFLNAALRRFKLHIENRKGRVIKFLGDGLMAAFGVPSVREDDAERALRAGLDMLEEVAEYAEVVKEKWGIEGYNIRVGIDTGSVIVGGGVEAEESFVGMAASVAKRMEEAAPVGGLLITANTYQQVYGLFEVEPQPLLIVKGVMEPIQTYLVKKRIPRHFHIFRHGVPGLTTPMFGRDKELSRLRALYTNTLRQGKASSLTILGEAGIGKSRLMIEFDWWMALQDDPGRCFRGRGFRSQQGSPYWILRMFLSNYCRIQDSDPREILLHKLETKLAGFLEEDGSRKVHAIGTLLGYTFPDSQFTFGQEEAHEFQKEALYYLEQLFAEMLKEGWVAILVEDVHWADEPSIDFLHALEESSSVRPLLIVYLARPSLLERFPNWFSDLDTTRSQYTKMELKPLQNEDSHRLINEILSKAQGLPPALVDSISRRAEGNPFYIEELIKVLMEEGIILLPKDGRSWKVDQGKLGRYRIPPTLTAVLQARLDRLSMTEKLLLQRAAIIGRTFWVGALAWAGVGDSDVGRTLNSLVDRDLIYQKAASTFIGQAEYSFRHGLLRDAAYETVLIWDRTGHHLQSARWLNEMTERTGRQDEFAAVIADHYELGDEHGSAADWYFRAGVKARNQGAPVEAVDFFDRALGLLPIDASERRMNILLAKEGPLGRLGNFNEQLTALETSIEFAGERGDDTNLAMAYSRLGFCYRNLGRYQEEIEAYGRSIAAAKKSTSISIEAHSMALLAHCLLRHGDLDKASLVADESMQLASGLDDEVYKAKTLTNIGGFYSESGDIAKAAQLFSELVTICSRLDLRYGEAVNLSNLGYNYILLGLAELAIPHLIRAIEIAESIGALHHKDYCQLNLGLGHYRLGEFSQAKNLIEEALSAFVEYEDRFGQASGSLYLGLTLEGDGDFKNALSNYTRARKIFEELAMPGSAVDAAAGVGRCFLSNRDIEEAQREADTVWEYLSSPDGRALEFPSLAYQTILNTYEINGDNASAALVTQAANDDLMQRADRIGELKWRQTYLRNNPELEVKKSS